MPVPRPSPNLSSSSNPPPHPTYSATSSIASEWGMSATPSPVPTSPPELPNGPQQQVLYVTPDGSSHFGTWPPEPPQDPSSSKGASKRSLGDGFQRRRGRVQQRDLPAESPASESHSSNLLPRQRFPPCNDVGNDVTSCYPMSNTTIFQGEWTKFIWNVNQPEFIGLPGQVDVYLYHADSGQLVEKWSNINNYQGQINVVANDSFWDYRMSQWSEGRQIPYTYYFIVVKAGSTLTGGEPRQATWTAIQTAYADSVYQSLSSVASTASLAQASAISVMGPASVSYFSVSSVSATSIQRAMTASPVPSGTAGLQGNGNSNDGSSFPGWAIALLVIFGFLGFAAASGLAWLLIRNYRRKRRFPIRDSTDSSTPMVQAPSEHQGSPVQSPVSAYARGGPLALAGAAAARGDGASTRSVSDAGPFSGQDAAIMADAFRKALRKPDFADQPVLEGESPDSLPPPPKPDVISRELAEEGRDIRSVSSVRGVTVQSLEGDSAEGPATTSSITHNNQRRPS